MPQCTLCGKAEPNFIGWKGESYHPASVWGREPGSTGATSTPASPRRWLERLSWRPRAQLFHNFLSAEECNQIIELARPRITRSNVIDSTTGQEAEDPIRTSWGTFLRRGETDLVAEVESRIASWTMLPTEHGEDIQVLRYQNGQKYDAHWDWFDDPVKHKTHLGAGNRVATVLMYLSDVEEGGETAFPQSIGLEDNQPRHNKSWSSCPAGHVAVHARKGDALMFWDLQPDGQTGDPASMHAGCPVIAGEKWSATKWIHTRPYGGTAAHVEQPTDCMDLLAECGGWAKQGECERNAVYMIGDVGFVGQCRKSCEVCIDCPPGDVLCGRRNQRLRSLQQK
ncbi:hypothetical protein WJX72_011443 [[Myrmecia] bisecta]|uniref:procollagen-proline 4-dioxygenase n=1 Tax=[Myrmecia] bisecta TaxID=41462 RepID=A0AAW1PY92_9CHLO